MASAWKVGGNRTTLVVDRATPLGFVWCDANTKADSLLSPMGGRMQARAELTGAAARGAGNSPEILQRPRRTP